MDSRPYCFQTGHPLGFAVQLRLTPELKQALINARANGEAVSLRFREEPREAVISIAGQEHFFSTAPQAGQLEVVEVTPKSKGAVSVAAVKQRLTLQRAMDSSDARPRSSLAAGIPEDRKKRSAVLLDGSQRGPGMHPRVTTEVVTRTAPQPPPQPSAIASGSGRLSGANGMAPLAGSSLRGTHGSGPSGPRGGANGADGAGLAGGPPRKPMELPKPRSQQPGGGAAKAPPAKARKTPTPPPPEMLASAAASAAAAAGPPAAAGGNDGGRQGGGGSGGGSGSGGGGGSSPVGFGSAAGGGGAGGSGGGSAPAAAAAPAPAPLELPRTAVLAARRGDLPLVVAALLREQPLTGSSLQSRIDAAYRAAGAKPEAREYVKRVMDNSCTMQANRMHLKPDVLVREGPRLDELVSGTSPTAGDTPFASTAGATAAGAAAASGRPAAGRAGQGQGQGSSLKRMASCSPDPRLSPDQDPSTGAGAGGRSADDAAVSVGTADDEEEGSMHNHHSSGHHHHHAGTARGARLGPAAAKRQRTMGQGGAGSGAAAAAGGGGAGAGSGAQQQQGSRQGGGGGRAGGGGSGLQGYDDFDDLADPPVASAPPREGSSGRPPGQGLPAGRAAAAKAAAAAKQRGSAGPGAGAGAAAGAGPVLSSGGPRGLPSFAALPSVQANGMQAQQQASQPAAAAAAAPSAPAGRPRPAGVVVASGAGGRAGSVSPVATHGVAAGGAPAAAAPTVSAPAVTRATQEQSDDSAVKGKAAAAVAGGAARGVEGEGLGSAVAAGTGGKRMGADGMTPAGTGSVGAAATSVDGSESALDPEMQPYADLDLQEEDKDADWYRTYVDWKPEPHAAVQSLEQYEQYEREYRAKYDVYHRLNQKYNEVVREADAQRAAVDAARGEAERHRCVLALWRLGASKWRLLEIWKRARRNLHADLGDLRSRVAEYVSRQGGGQVQR